jgi:hypothetical protein
LDPDPDLVPDPDPSIISKNIQKNLDSYCFVTSFLKMMLNVLQKVIRTKTLKANLVGILKVNDEDSRIRIH